jgi:2-desacetyl-2-hydroxyethyl bacteriochlorophyllide A dehydrogenase
MLHEPGHSEIVTIPDPAPRAGEVVLAVAGCGICGTDIHIYDGEFAPTPYPIVPGHEFAGRVVAIGGDVDGLAVGDFVAADCTLVCGRCVPCRSGRYNLCHSWGAIGDTVDGAFAEFVRVPARSIYRWPGSVPQSWAVLAEPLACVVHALDRLGAVSGTRALVLGAGVIGALAAQLLRRNGVATLTVLERSQDRRDVVAGFGVDHAVAEFADLGDEEFDVVVDATGAISVIENGLTRTAPGGRFLLIGVAPADAMATVSPYQLFKSEITVLGSMSKLYSFEPALRLLEHGLVDVGPMLGAPLPLTSYPEAIEQARNGMGMKVVLVP